MIGNLRFHSMVDFNDIQRSGKDICYARNEIWASLRLLLFCAISEIQKAGVYRANTVCFAKYQPDKFTREREMLTGSYGIFP